MRPEWGRADAAGAWPNPKPAWTIATVFLAATTTLATSAAGYATVWTPLQRLYLSAYLRTALMSAIAVTATGTYPVLEVIDRHGTHLALDEEVIPVITPDGQHSWALSEAARRSGDVRLTWQASEYPHATLHAFLRHWIYRDQSLADLLRHGLWAGLAVLVLGLAIAIPKDAARRRERREGRRLKGPELVTVTQFNQRLHADGIAFLQTPSLIDLPRRQDRVRIPRALESSHLLIMGDSGTGKSALIRQLLQQLDARAATAIVYDPALEYTPQFYTPERGDLILNPLDARSPYWSPGDEVRHQAEALTLATSLFPDRHEQNPFFTDGARRIFAHLLTLRPSAEDLTHWLCHEDEIDQRLAGTAYAVMVDRHAPQQRSGVLASLNMVADALALLPAARHTTRRWSAAAWSTDRRGWLFLTSTPQTRDRLRPLTSLWLDLLVLRLMPHGQPAPRPVWFILDELASLQRLPQLHTAITENRKSQNPVVLGFQGRSQLETRYGHDAEAMISQPATKIFLRTSEAHAAKWISDTIGEVEIERLTESRQRGHFGQTRTSLSHGLQRQVEPLVMASEISGLAPLRGFLKLGNLVVRLRFPFVTLPHKQPAFIERPKSDPPRPTEATTHLDGLAPSHREHRLTPSQGHFLDEP